jgi:hypothetical protein
VICIGIDPGLTGAISFIDSRGTCVIEDLPTMTLPGNGMIKRKIDGRALADLVHRHCALGEGAPLVLCEQVRAMGGKNNAVQTQGSLMRTLGAVEAVLEVLRYPPRMVEPQTWKRFYGLGKEKPEAMLKARALYPSAEHLLRRVKDHNRAESLLIAHWGMRNLA